MGTKVSTSFTLECALLTLGNKLFMTLQSTQSLFLGGSPRAILLGTITIGLAQGETLLVITPAFSSVSNSFCTNLCASKANYMAFHILGDYPQS